MVHDNYYCVIMAGGIGSRFWPFSRKNLPKQFLDFLGTGCTLLQETFNRYRQVISADHIYIATNTEYRDIVLQQLPEIDESQLILEDVRRNTAPAIAHAAFVIKEKNPDAVMIVAPSDHIILKQREFEEAIRKGLEFAVKNDKLLTLGIRPHRPETGYGYIQVDEQVEDSFYKVKTFIEKPALEFAQLFVNSNEFYWNSGIFIWNAATILKEIHQYMANLSPKMECEDPDFMSCPSISVDFAVMEKTSNVYVQVCDFGWTDLGTWNTLYDMAPKDEQQNVTSSNVLLYDCKESIILVPEDKLAVVQGLQDYLVALKDNALLICKKDDQNAIRKFVNDVQLKFDDRYL